MVPPVKKSKCLVKCSLEAGFLAFETDNFLFEFCDPCVARIGATGCALVGETEKPIGCYSKATSEPDKYLYRWRTTF